MIARVLNTKAGTVAVGLVVGAAILYWAARAASREVKEAAAGAAAAVGEAVNPTSDQNVAYRGVNAVGAALSGDPSWSLGSWLYDRFNPPYDPNAQYEPRQTQVRKTAAVADYLVHNG